MRDPFNDSQSNHIKYYIIIYILLDYTTFVKKAIPIRLSTSVGTFVLDLYVLYTIMLMFR